MSINAVLSEIQKKLSVPKSRRNSFGGYNYRSAEDIIDAVKLILPEGWAILLSDEMIVLGDRFYIKSTAILLGGEGEKEQVRSFGYAREPLAKKGFDESQITGSASSYARKYALNGLLAIDDGVDADSQDSAPKTSKASKPPQTPKEWFLVKIATLDSEHKFNEFMESQKNKDARDKLFVDDKPASQQVENAIDNQRKVLAIKYASVG